MFPRPLARTECRGEASRCRSKLPTPVFNELEAFCTRGCHSQFYRSRCVVCETKMERKTENRLVCSKRKCRSALAARLGFGRYLPSSDAIHPLKTSIKPGIKSGLKPDRAWRIIAGPELSPTSFRFATLPLDDPADRVSRVNRGYWKEARRTAEERGGIKRHHPPVNILGGYKFPDAPAIDLRALASPPASAPSPIVGDGLDIPDFLLRRPHQNQMRMAA
jgi:hypothetical protein